MITWKPSILLHLLLHRRCLSSSLRHYLKQFHSSPLPALPVFLQSSNLPTSATHFSLPTSTQTVLNNLAASQIKKGSFQEALRLLDEIPQPNLFSFNLAISCYNRLGRFDESFKTFLKIFHVEEGIFPDSFTYGGILSACAEDNGGNVHFGEQVHSLVIRNGFLSNAYVLSGLIDLFAKKGSFDDALRVFSDVKLKHYNVVCWNSIIAGGIRNGEKNAALELFREMVGAGCCLPNAFTLSSVLNACAAVSELDIGVVVHCWVFKCKAMHDVVVGTALIDMYAKCCDMEAALKQFQLMPDRNVVSWTTVISGFVQNDKADAAMCFFKEMLGDKVEVNRYTLTSVLAACTKVSSEESTSQIHCWLLKTGLYMDMVTKGTLLGAYAKIGSIQLSDKIFQESSMVESPSTWTAMICSLAQNYNAEKSVEFFQMMLSKGLKPDNFCCSSVLSILESLDSGRQLHSYIFKTGFISDNLLVCSLFNMYSKCGCLEESYELFKQMPEIDRVSWSSMIGRFAEYGCSDEAFRLFRQMQLSSIVPDHVTLSGLLAACNGPKYLRQGKEIHGYVLRTCLSEEDLVVGSLITMYSKCNSALSAGRVFYGLQVKDKVIWSSLISCYAANGHSNQALAEFQLMRIVGHAVDSYTASSVLCICSTLPRPILGKQLHTHVVKAGLQLHQSVSCALVTMYSKCGSISEACKIFDETINPDVVAWTAMINAYAEHGRGLEGLQTFDKMRSCGIKPDSMTMVSVFSACSHNGLVDEGLLHFNSLKKDYDIEPGPRHYSSVVDLLGRAGRLKEAAEFIDKMPAEADHVIWSTLLGACRVHDIVELGRIAARKVLKMQSSNSGAYISLSNISAGFGNWDEVLKIRDSMDQAGSRKEVGRSIMSKMKFY